MQVECTQPLPMALSLVGQVTNTYQLACTLPMKTGQMNVYMFTVKFPQSKLDVKVTLMLLNSGISKSFIQAPSNNHIMFANTLLVV